MKLNNAKCKTKKGNNPDETLYFSFKVARTVLWTDLFITL